MNTLLSLVFSLFILVTNPFYSDTNKKNNTTTTTNFSHTGREWYISISKGSGQLGTKEKAAKDLGNIIYHLKPNDIIYIAEGIYE